MYLQFKTILSILDYKSILILISLTPKMQQQNKPQPHNQLLPASQYKLYFQSPSTACSLNPQHLASSIQSFISSHPQPLSHNNLQYLLKPLTPQPPIFTLYIRSQRKDCLLAEFFISDTVRIARERLAYYLGMDEGNVVLVSRGKRVDAELEENLRGLVADGQFLYVVDKGALEYRKGRVVVEKTFESLAKTITVSCQDTLSELFSKVQSQTLVNRNCFNLFHLGAFLPHQSPLTLKQSLIADGCQLKATVNQKKLLMVQNLAELMATVVLPMQGIRDCGSLAQLVQDADLVGQVIGFLKNTGRKVEQKGKMTERVLMEDQYDREIGEIYESYWEVIVGGAREINQGNMEASRLFVLSGVLSFLKIERDFHIEVFLLDCVMFNRQRKDFFFTRLTKILQTQTPCDTKLLQLTQLIDWLLNKCNFARIDRLSGYQISLLHPKIHLLIQTLYQSSNPSTISQYLQQLQSNCYTLDGLPDILTFENGYILINLRMLEEVNSQFDVFSQISVLYYLLALHYPLYGCREEEEEELMMGIKENMSNMQNQEFVSSLTQLLFREELGEEDTDDY